MAHFAPSGRRQRRHRETSGPAWLLRRSTSLFAALDVVSGFVIGKCYKRHRAVEFLKFLKEIDAQVPEGLDVHIVMDNYATHKTPKIKAWLTRRPHYYVNFTPTSASWIWTVTRKCHFSRISEIRENERLPSSTKPNMNRKHQGQEKSRAKVDPAHPGRAASLPFSHPG